jgi:hypothetical protein
MENWNLYAARHLQQHGSQRVGAKLKALHALQGCCPSRKEPNKTCTVLLWMLLVTLPLALSLLGGGLLTSTGDKLSTSMNSLTDTLMDQVHIAQLGL